MGKTNKSGKADKRVSGVILMVVGLLLLIFAISEQLGVPQSLALARDAVYVADGQVKAENEGQLVIVTGTLNQSGNVTDPLLGLTFDAPVLYRVVEAYELDSTIGDGVWSWERQYSSDAQELACGYVTGDVMLGEFTLAEDILSGFPTDSYYASFSGEELTQAGLHTETVGDITYLTQAEGVSQGTTYSIWGLLSNEDVRISYQCFDTAQTPTVTLIARQSGNTLTLADLEDVSFSSVASGTLTKEEFLSAASEELTQSNLWVALVAVALLAWGVYRFVKYYIR